MEPDIQAAFVKDLRAFADFIERKGAKLPIDAYDTEFTVRAFLYDDTVYDYETKDTKVTKSSKQKMTEVARNIGKAEKVWSDDYLDIRKDFGSISLEFSVTR